LVVTFFTAVFFLTAFLFFFLIVGIAISIVELQLLYLCVIM